MVLLSTGCSHRRRMIVGGTVDLGDFAKINYLALAAKLGLADPAEPLYFMKAPSSCLDPEASIIAPAGQGMPNAHWRYRWR